MTKTVTRAEFIAWLKTKPADKPACLDDINHCVMAEYGRDQGLRYPEAGTSVIWNGLSNPVQIGLTNFTFHDFEGAKTYGEVIEKLENPIDTSDNFTTI